MQYSDTVLEMLNWFADQGAMVAGYSATPFRMDGRPMAEGGFYQEVLANHDIRWAIDNGWAVPPVCRLARVDSLDLSSIKITNGDFNATALNAAIEKEATLHRLALITEQERQGQTVVFTPSVASAKGVCHYLTNNYGVPATYVYGTMPEDERREALRRFKAREVQVLVNCQVVAVGFDYPPTQTLILGRPTKSRTFWLQAVGRATRPLAGNVDFAGSTPESRKAAIAASGKPTFKIVDCTDSSLDHRLVTAVDMFVQADPAVKDAVKRAAIEAPAPLSQEELDALAFKELERQRLAAEIEARRKLMQGRATGSVVGRNVDLQFTGVRCVGTYTNPLRGKYAGRKMSELPDHYVEWGNRTLTGWVQKMFGKELVRRWKGRTTC
jgi:superfamily II DNA or RNA helicase